MKRAIRLFAFVLCTSLFMVSWSSATQAKPIADEPVVETDFGTTSIAWGAPQGTAGFLLVVSGPDGYRFEQTFAGGTLLAFQAVDADGAPLADGLYKYELTPIRYDRTKALSVGDDGRSPAESRQLKANQVQSSDNLEGVSGAFTIENGAILDPNRAEETIVETIQPQQGSSPSVIDAPADQVINDDLIVSGSQCVGQDCVNGENFGFDTLRLKENNLRLHFDDTSSSASFPKNDWRITANDSSNGGASYLAIEDATAGRIPFRVEAGAPNHSLYVEDSGDVGVGTNNPAVELHIVDGDSPTLRLEQNGSSGWTPQTWDIAGNETNFFIRDVTNGSKLPFRIRPNAPTSTIDMFSDRIVINDGSANYDTRIEGDAEQNLFFVDASADKIGIGTSTPSASLHVQRSDRTTRLLIEESNASANYQDLLHLKNNGNPYFVLQDTRNGIEELWIGSNGDDLDISRRNITSGAFTALMRINNSKNATFFGTVTTTGSCSGGCRAKGDAYGATVLAKLPHVPVVQWQGMDTAYLGDGKDVETTHIGPDTAAFHQMYGLGIGDNSIAPLDVATVALAAAQALNEQAQLHSTQIDSLRSQLSSVQQENADLQARLAAIEAALNLPTPESGASKSSIFVPSVQR